MTEPTKRGPAETTSSAGPRHGYQVDVVWTGNTGQGTTSYRSYRRTHEIRAENKTTIDGSADPAFRGDDEGYNPEELLVASLSQCHMLWYLHLAADTGVVVLGYHDRARGTLTENADGTGQFAGVVLCPEVTVPDHASVATAEALHQRAHELCYVAKSVNFPVEHEPSIRVAH